ncbi:MAG: 50S ribosomal protein L11 methyltransferase [Pseudomonadales bacterium]|nr:50S ribosomal protein L11 methyltransferase [Pseudomonadales bacterium]
MNDLLTKNLNQTITTGSLAVTPLPLSPEISLYLISADYPKGRLPDEEMHAIIDKPAYWAFCWASGQVLAAHLVAHPEICRNKTVLDLGAGSGVVAIAAAISGATSVIACDLDKHALEACIVNGKANQVELDTLEDLELCVDKVDLLIAADVLYDRENIPWLERLGSYADEVLIADSRIRDESIFESFEKIGNISATTIPDLDEMKEFGDVTIYYRKYR